MSKVLKDAIDLPIGWKWSTLVDCASILDSQRVPLNSKQRTERIEGKSVEELFPYYGATGQVGFIDDFIFEGEYILLGEDGAPFFDKSKNVAYIAKGRFWVNNHAHILDAKKRITNNQYLLHYLNGFSYKGFVGGTTRLKLNQGNLKKIPVPLAPLEQQKRIVAKIEELFSHIDAGIEALNKAKTLLKQYRQSVLKAAVTGELTKEWREQNKDKLEPASLLLERILKERRKKWEAQQLKQFEAKGKVPKDDKWKGKYKKPQKSNESYMLPQGWTVCLLEQLILELKNGISNKPTEDDGLAILRISAVRPMAVHNDDVRFLPKGFDKKDFELKSGDLLFTRYNGNPELVGVCGKVKNLKNITVYPDKLMRARPVNLEMLCTDYLELSLNCGISKDFIRSITKTTAGQSGVAGGDVKRCPIVLPPYEEQVEIANIVSNKIGSIERLNFELEAQLNKAEKNKQSILASAFSGKLS